MSSEFKQVSFSTHAHIKNIIGKELINDDNVAVMFIYKDIQVSIQTSYDSYVNKASMLRRKVK